MSARILAFTPKPAPEVAPAVSPLAAAIAMIDQLRTADTSETPAILAELTRATAAERPDPCEGRTIWNSDGIEAPVLICAPPPVPASAPTDRDNTIAAIRAALKRRSGRPWSVTGGRGTAWGWITIDAPPARCTWRHVLKPDAVSDTGMENYDDADSGRPGGHMSPADRATLRALLGCDVHTQGVSIPASSDYYREYVERAEGRPVTKVARPYWD